MKELSLISKILLKQGLSTEVIEGLKIPIIQKIKDKMLLKKELLFILPAFPAKSSSSDKTLGHLPDMAEVIALKNLNHFCEEISGIYAPGAKAVICSDGRAFGDIVNVSDDKIDSYSFGIEEIINDYELRHLSLFRMDDIYPDLSPVDLRELLVSKFANPTEFIRKRVKEEDSFNKLFNGVHRFLFEDEVFHSRESRNQINRTTKNKTYELLKRSEAWSVFIDQIFPDSLRLSIHPHELTSEKFGICLVPGPSKWATPWHNVLVKIEDRFELMHRKEALKLNPVLKRENDKYAYFEI